MFIASYKLEVDLIMIGDRCFKDIIECVRIDFYDIK